ncbi:hypothetical protein TSH64_02510 [Azospirillum sp. TSH64]|nr:hypothetical protein TSH64_02510 [Azospirillum sp. TSH64]
MLNEIAAMQAEFDLARRKPFHLNANFIFVEKMASSVEFLRNEIATGPHAKRLDQSAHIINSTFEEQCSTILEKVKSRGRAHRAIFFLDQYGYNTVSFFSIRRILTELEHPEIVLTFSVDALINYLSNDEAFLKGILPTGLTRDDVLHMLQIKSEQRGWRWMIQHFLYERIVALTGAPFYTCFYVKSPESHRSYWLLHLSTHPKARDEMGAQHWELHNHFVHHGRAGLRMLGYDSTRDNAQPELDFMFQFDEQANTLSQSALLAELPPLIHAICQKNGTSISVGELYRTICNQTPAISLQMSDVLVALRQENEVQLLTAEGRPMPRATKLDWKDRVQITDQPTFFSFRPPAR